MKRFSVILFFVFFVFSLANGQLGMATTVEGDYEDLLIEEKLAHDVYQTFYNKYEAVVFENILEAEKHHYSLMADLINKKTGTKKEFTFGELGVFDSEEFQLMFNVLSERGKKSLEEALKVGAQIEETDIQDLREVLKMETDANSVNLFKNLISASENHLRAFVKNLDRLGFEYSPVLLSKEDFTQIVTSENSCTGSKGKDKACCSKEKKGKDKACCSKEKGKNNQKGKSQKRK